jgi:hypothetical protein
VAESRAGAITIRHTFRMWKPTVGRNGVGPGGRADNRHYYHQILANPLSSPFYISKGYRNLLDDNASYDDWVL